MTPPTFFQIQKIIMSTGSTENAAPIGGEGKESRKDEGNFDIWDLIVNSGSEEMKTLLGHAKESNLPQNIASYVQSKEMETGVWWNGESSMEELLIEMHLNFKRSLLKRLSNCTSFQVNWPAWNC